MAQLKVAIIGQSPFAAEVYKLLRQNGHQVTGVFTIPDKGNREDPLGMDTSIKIENSVNTRRNMVAVCLFCICAYFVITSLSNCSGSCQGR